MQIANPTTQTTTTAASTPVQQISTPTAAATQAGNIVMVITIKSLFHLHSPCINIIQTCSDYRATMHAQSFIYTKRFIFKYILMYYYHYAYNNKYLSRLCFKIEQ
jgi:hypothetical protein